MKTVNLADLGIRFQIPLYTPPTVGDFEPAERVSQYTIPGLDRKLTLREYQDFHYFLDDVKGYDEYKYFDLHVSIWEYHPVCTGSYGDFVNTFKTDAGGPTGQGGITYESPGAGKYMGKPGYKSIIRHTETGLTHQVTITEDVLVCHGNRLIDVSVQYTPLSLKDMAEREYQLMQDSFSYY
jgi:hypothetical protein